MNTRKNYNFFYDRNNAKRKVRGHNVPETTPDEVKAFKPSAIAANDASTPYLEFSDSTFRDPNPGKWILTFPKGDSKIDEAWRLLVDGVVDGTIVEVKASFQNYRFDGQVICVYTRNAEDIKDIVRVYDYLDQKGLLAYQIKNYNEAFGYKSDMQTHQNQAVGDQRLYTNNDIIDIKRKHQNWRKL